MKEIRNIFIVSIVGMTPLLMIYAYIYLNPTSLIESKKEYKGALLRKIKVGEKSEYKIFEVRNNKPYSYPDFESIDVQFLSDDFYNTAIIGDSIVKFPEDNYLQIYRDNHLIYKFDYITTIENDEIKRGSIHKKELKRQIEGLLYE
jgi:hypothetical protein